METTHPFSKTLGPAPYRYIGLIEIKISPNGGFQIQGSVPRNTITDGIGTCSHCGMPILNCFIVETGEGKRFGVGSDCIFKVGLPAEELSKLKLDERTRQKEVRKNLKKRKGEEARVKIQSLMAEKEAVLKFRPHPSEYMASQRKTLYNYCEWILRHSTDGGIVIAFRKIENLLK